MATKQQSLTPLIDIQSAAFAEQYERGVSWSMYGDEQGKGPVPANRDAKRGYRAGREFFFVEAEPHERRMTEGYLLERLRESVTEMAHWKDVDSTWFFSVGCLLGELSGHLFPMNGQERKVYLPQHQRLEQARKRHTTAQKPLRSAILQEA